MAWREVEKGGNKRVLETTDYEIHVIHKDKMVCFNAALVKDKEGHEQCVQFLRDDETGHVAIKFTVREGYKLLGMVGRRQFIEIVDRRGNRDEFLGSLPEGRFLLSWEEEQGMFLVKNMVIDAPVKDEANGAE